MVSIIYSSLKERGGDPMVNVGSFDAKTHLPALLKRVIKGEMIQITRRGTPVAKLVPVDTQKSNNPRQAAMRIRRSRAQTRLGKQTVRELIDEGRRF